MMACDEDTLFVMFDTQSSAVLVAAPLVGILIQMLRLRDAKLCCCGLPIKCHTMGYGRSYDATRHLTLNRDSRTQQMTLICD